MASGSSFPTIPENGVRISSVPARDRDFKENSRLAVGQKAKIDKYNERKENLRIKPSKVSVISKWIITCIFGLLFLTCLAFSKLSVIGVGRSLKQKSNDSNENEALNILALIIMIPYALSTLRSLWVMAGRKDMLWPKCSAIIWCIVSSVMEVIGIGVFVCEAFSHTDGVYAVLIMDTTLLVPTIMVAFKGIRGRLQGARKLLFIIAVLCAIGGEALTFYLIFKSDNSMKTRIAICASSVIISLSWIPLLQEKSMNTKSQSTNNDNTTSQEIPRGSFRMHRFPRNQISSEISSDRRSHWKTLFISSSIKLILILPVMIVYKYVIDDKRTGTEPFDEFIKGWNWTTNDMHVWYFVTNISTGIFGYIIGVFACRTCMYRGGFLLPIFLSTPLCVSLLAVNKSCSELLDVEGLFSVCSFDMSNLTFVLIATGCFFLSQILSYGVIALKSFTIVLEKETKLFRFATFNGVLLGQWMLSDKRIELKEQTSNLETREEQRKSRVFICTTMYRENRKEMKQLLESINAVNTAQMFSNKRSRLFESHIFLDGAIIDEDPQENALQLLSLLEETLNIKDLRTGTKTITPYGMRMSWRLNSTDNLPRGMEFNIHFKDIRKVKNKKRWSQIMYISYVLDFLNENMSNPEGNPSSEEEAFILTTDADVCFDATDVEALLDLMTRDHTVGAVCARTHPLGGGPLVWYQKFEYAIGHWFQKAAEHILGSVLCAPGCFSVYRCSALRDIVPIYASRVEKAFDFLIKDMGEDRWLCTLMVQSGWRIEYCAASENQTFCPEEFDEFYKQRRRWIASTLANIWKLISEWKLISGLNHKVSILFCLYQIFLFASTIVGPSTIIMVVSGGLTYAWGANMVATVIIQLLVCILFTVICLKMNQKNQLMVAKVLTFVYSLIMAAVAVGIAIQVAKDFEHPGKSESEDDPEVQTKAPDAIAINFPYSVTTVYLTFLASLFLVTGIAHLKEFLCLLYGFVYLLCLPSCYLILLIYCICNITDRSWGTREGSKDHELHKSTLTAWYQNIQELIQTVFFCCFKKKPAHTDRETQTLTSVEEGGIGEGEDTVDGLVRTEMWSPAGLQGQLGSKGMRTIVFRQKPSGEKIKTVKEWLNDRNMEELYADKLSEHGYENEIFLSGLTEKTLKKEIGVKIAAHRNYLMTKVARLPPFSIDVQVPSDVEQWLNDIGLWMYKDKFFALTINTPEGLEALKDMSEKQIKEELGITKHGHLKRLLMAIDKLRYPTDEELSFLGVKDKVSRTQTRRLDEDNESESQFWMTLIDACLKPDRDAFGRQAELKKGLESLRLQAIMGLWVLNCLWLVLALSLAGSAELTAAGTNPLGLVFLIVFGFIFVIQFFCMIIHRFETLSHFIARLPYSLSDTYNASFKFIEDDTDHQAYENLVETISDLHSSNDRLNASYRSRASTSDENTYEKQTLLSGKHSRYGSNYV